MIVMTIVINRTAPIAIPIIAAIGSQKMIPGMQVVKSVTPERPTPHASD